MNDLDIAAKLGAQLEKTRNELEQGRLKLAAYEETNAWRWTQHRLVPPDAYPGLPIPRLQLEVLPLDKGYYNTVFRYELIYRHYNGEVYAVPIGETRCSGGYLQEEPMREPFRESFHIRHDAAQFKLPAYRIRGSTYEKLGTVQEYRDGKAVSP